jgi:hypothetical protein
MRKKFISISKIAVSAVKVDEIPNREHARKHFYLEVWIGPSDNILA